MSQSLDGARVYIGTLPRPAGVQKVDLNDFLRGGGDLDAVIAEAVPAGEHPGVLAEQKKMYARVAAGIKRQRDQQRWIASGKKPRRGESIEDLKARMPDVSTYTGIPPGGRGPHPIYGSIHGDNFAVSEDGQTWTSFHGGEAPGKSGNIFKLIAMEQGFMTDEREDLRGEAFKQTIEYCRRRWGP